MASPTRKTPTAPTAAVTSPPPAAAAVGESHRVYWQQWLPTRRGPSTNSSNSTNAATHTTAPNAAATTATKSAVALNRRSGTAHSSTTTTTTTTSSSSASSSPSPLVRREWITSSVAVRMTLEARAMDVTNLLRDRLGLNPPSTTTTPSSTPAAKPNDALVLVGTLYSLPLNHVQFETLDDSLSSNGTLASRTAALAATTTTSSRSNHINNTQSSGRSEPVHLVYTLRPDESPLELYHRMQQRIQTLSSSSSSSSSHAHPSPQQSQPSWQSLQPTSRPIMAPQLQWFFVPDVPSTNNNSTTTTASHPHWSIPNCLHLEGYCTSMEDNESEEDDDENHTGMVFDDDDDDDQDETKGDNNNNKRTATTSNNSLQEEMEAKFPWLRPSGSADSNANDDTNDKQDEEGKDASPSSSSSHQQRQRQRRHRWNRIRTRERQRAQQFDQCRGSRHGSSSTTTGTTAAASTTMTTAKKTMTTPRRPLRSPSTQCMSGYLLKQCHVDRHVWRRMYCVVTDDYLWFQTRIYHHHYYSCSDSSGTTDRPGTAPANEEESEEMYSWSRHGRLRLTRALLLQPVVRDVGPTNHNPSSSSSSSSMSTTLPTPLDRTPHAFELVTPDGTSHVFRATNPHEQGQWIRVLSERMVQSYENSLLEQAQLLLVDECQAQCQRMEQTVLTMGQDLHASGSSWSEPTQEATSPQSRTFGWFVFPKPFANDNNHKNDQKDTPHKFSSDKCLIRRHCLLQWALQVSDYRECCRYVQSILPPPRPVVAASAMNAAVAAAQTSTPSKTNSTTTATATPNNNHNSTDKAPRRPSLKTHAAAAIAVLSLQQHHDVSSSSSSSSSWAMSSSRAFSPHVRSWIRECWIRATRLLQVLSAGPSPPFCVLVDPESNTPKTTTTTNTEKAMVFSYPRRIETLLRHIEYVITGRHAARPTGRSGTSTSTSSTTTGDATVHQTMPPPLDLFDPLLRELQTLVAPDQDPDR